MLTAAVAGDVFSSPSTEAILAAIRSVATEAGYKKRNIVIFFFFFFFIYNHRDLK